jgi:acetyltransferase-like isoleucine patch superfamily enzyme
MTASLNFPGIAAGARLGANVTIASDVVIMDGAEIGDNVKIEPGAIIYENVKIGKNSFVGAQCILGERLLGYLRDANYKNPPLTIGDDSIIRSGTIIYANCIIGHHFQTGHRAVIREESRFGDNCSFGTLAQSDGNIVVGNNCRFHNNVFIATFTTIEDNVCMYPLSSTFDALHPPCQKGRQGPYLEEGVIVCGNVMIMPRVRVGKGAILAGGAVVTHDIPANMIAAGSPAKVIKNKGEVRCHLEDRPAWEVAIESIG